MDEVLIDIRKNIQPDRTSQDLEKLNHDQFNGVLALIEKKQQTIHEKIHCSHTYIRNIDDLFDFIELLTNVKQVSKQLDNFAGHVAIKYKISKRSGSAINIEEVVLNKLMTKLAKMKELFTQIVEGSTNWYFVYNVW